MAKARSIRLFTHVWIGLVLIGILGHYLIDTSAAGCLLENRPVCGQETADRLFVTVDLASASASLPHAGFALPSPAPFVAAFQISLLLIIVLAEPAGVSLPILLPPPR
ncbi:MAG: hypothetical protein KDE28_01050 [Anaerolineales bacterium]|nr:hypothetical protein [Anaerolineales bacterium]